MDGALDRGHRLRRVAHQLQRSHIEGHRVHTGQDGADGEWLPAGRSVTIHAHHCVHHRQRRAHKADQVEQHVGKAIGALQLDVVAELGDAWYGAEQVLDRACVAHEPVGLELGHRDDDVDLVQEAGGVDQLDEVAFGMGALLGLDTHVEFRAGLGRDGRPAAALVGSLPAASREGQNRRVVGDQGLPASLADE